MTALERDPGDCWTRSGPLTDRYLPPEMLLMGRESRHEFGPSAMRVIAAIILTLVLAGCGEHHPYHYKLTLIFRDHGHLESFSGVRSVNEVVGPNGMGSAPRLCGEAIPIRLKDGRALFVLLNGFDHEMVTGQVPWGGGPTWLLIDRHGLSTNDRASLKKLETFTDAIDLHPGYELPETVIFGNIADAKTIKRIYLADIDSGLGADVQFEKATLAVTNEKVTRGRVAPIIPWLNSSNEFLDGTYLGRAVGRYHTWQFENCSRLSED